MDENGNAAAVKVTGDTQSEAESTGIKCGICKNMFENGFELSKHMSIEHPVINVSQMETGKADLKNVPPVVIKTTREVEVSINNKMYRGTEIEVPFAQAEDIKRILREGYGGDIFVM